MDRREFINYSLAGMAGLGLSGLIPLDGMGKLKRNEYNLIILGDTHYDTEPASVYHSHYNEPVEWKNRVQRAEFARNGEMWRERCPRLLKRAACLVDENTKAVLQMGDLIQGDCGNADVHRKMLDDVMNYFKDAFGGILPLVMVVGNHDIRGVDARRVFHEYMPARMSQELGIPVESANFSFNIGDDSFIVVDFNNPVDEEVDSLLKKTAGCRNTFIMVHGPVFPFDSPSCRWFWHGKNTPGHTAARLHFRKELAKRNAIVLTGHVHRTELADWYGDGGRITQMTFNSVWASPELDHYNIISEGAKEYGTMRANMKRDDGKPIEDETPVFDEYRAGLRRYSVSPAAGSYKLKVSDKGISVDFYAGDSTFVTKEFILR